MTSDYIATTHAVVSCICWFIVGCGATYAVFSPKVKDTLWERIALSAVGLFSIGTSFRVGRQGWITEGFLFISVALAFYVLIVIIKHLRGGRCSLPRDKRPSAETTWSTDAHL